MRPFQYFQVITLSALATAVATDRAAADDAQELAKKLSNPVASLISLPFQYNFDHNIGPVDDGRKHQLNFQPSQKFALPIYNSLRVLMLHVHKALVEKILAEIAALVRRIERRAG